MASSKGSPGPHDRRLPRTHCIKINKYNNKRCTRFAMDPRTKLCRSHAAQADAERARIAEADAAANTEPDAAATDNDPELETTAAYGNPIAQPTPAGIQRGGITTQVKKEGKRNLDKAGLGKFVINQQAAVALRRLGQPVAQNADPRQTLLDAVASSWRQVQVWEQMLAAVPPDDWQFVGVTPVPGSQLSAKGARIEAIQKYLGDATKSAARISKLAIDAGIEERLVRLAEEQSAMIADTVKAGILAAINVLIGQIKSLTPQQIEILRDSAMRSAATHLQLLAAGALTDPDDPSAAPTPIYEGTATRVR